MLGGKRALAYSIGERKELVPKVSGVYINFSSMKEDSSSIYHNYAYHGISDDKLIVLDIRNQTLWRSVSTGFRAYYHEDYCSGGICNSYINSELINFVSVGNGLVYNLNRIVYNTLTSIPFEFIGYEYTGTALKYKANQTTSLKFNEKSLEQFSSTLSSLTAGTTIPIKIHKKHVGHLIVRKSNKNVLYLEKDSSDNLNIVDIVINSKPEYVEQEISVVPLINTRYHLTRLGGKSSISKTLISN